ncbi:MAG: S49 family peptidase [Francisellaceae bacterium]
MSDQEHALEKIAAAYLKEQRRARRWRIFFRVCWLVVIVVILWWIFSAEDKITPGMKPHVGLVKLEGVIADDADANADRINKSLEKAFENSNTKGVILYINSPGGSPVQSDDIYEAMRYFEKKYPDKPLYAVCSDLCASGGYYIASAANEIYANKMSIVGSIGVRAGGFGFVELMKKIGVERRLYTAGKDKGFLDPFLPQNAAQVKDMDKMLDQTHQVFIDAVKAGRGDRLDLAESQVIFSGMPFSGIEGKKYGLIDAFGNVHTLVSEKFAKLPLVDYTEPLSLLDRISSEFGAEVMYHAEEAVGMKLQ